jgi:hypothetical protein
MGSTQERRSSARLIAAVTAIGVALAPVLFVVGCSGQTDEEPTGAGTETAATPSPEPSTDRDAEPPTAFALTLAGDLVELNPANGAVMRSIASNPLWQDSSLVISPDRAYAYVDAFDPTTPGGPEWPGEIQRVSLAASEPEGSAHVETVVTTATSPAISPDGGSLAYLSIAPGDPQTNVRSLTVMDLATGDVTASVPDDQCVECERRVTSPTWTPDSSSLIVGLGWFDGFPSTALVAVDPTSTATIGAGGAVGPDNSGDVLADWFGTTVFTAEGTLLIPAEEGTAAQWEARAAYAFGDGPKENQPTGLVAVVDVASGTVLSRIPVDGVAASVAAEPAGTDILVVVGHPDTDEVPALYRWDGSELVHIGDAYTAVAW